MGFASTPGLRVWLLRGSRWTNLQGVDHAVRIFWWWQVGVRIRSRFTVLRGWRWHRHERVSAAHYQHSVSTSIRRETARLEGDTWQTLIPPCCQLQAICWSETGPQRIRAGGLRGGVTWHNRPMIRNVVYLPISPARAGFSRWSETVDRHGKYDREWKGRNLFYTFVFN